MTDRELMQQALEALNRSDYLGWQLNIPIIKALRERLAQPEQEPIAWVYPEGLEAFTSGKPWTAYGSNGDGRIPLYLNDAVARKWQGLTDDEREQFKQWAHPDIIEAIELRLQERNT